MPWLIAILGYFIGSIPTAYIAGRVVKGVDVRRVGDANMGAANAFRQLGKRVGVVVGIVDAGKGALAVFIAQATNIPQEAIMITCAAAVIGHNWPIFIGFRGGRGESATIGVLLVLVTLPMLILGGASIITLLLTRKVPLASAVLFAPLSLLCWWLDAPGMLVGYSIALPCLVGFTHFLRTRRVASASGT